MDKFTHEQMYGKAARIATMAKQGVKEFMRACENAVIKQTVKARPQVGETVLVRHRSQARENGKIDLAFAKDKELRVITAIYMETGRVRDQAGDVWAVVPNTEKSSAKWMTID